MARPKNTEERERIQRNAFDLFSTKGIEASSFADIAKSSFVTKSLVQYYFPKKDKFITDFVQKSMDCVQKISEQSPGFSQKDPLEKLIFIAYIQFYFAMYNDKMSRLSIDILRDRAITKTVIDQAIQCNLDYLGDELEAKNLEEVRLILQLLYGGTFDYIYTCTVKGEEINIRKVIWYGTMMMNSVVEKPISFETISSTELNQEWLEAERKRYNRAMFSI